MVAAVAPPSAGDERRVTELSRRPVRPVQHAAAGDDAAAHAGSKIQHHQVAEATSRPVTPFGPRRGADVVHDRARRAERIGDHGAQRHAAPAEVGCADDHAVRLHLPGHRHAHRADAAGVVGDETARGIGELGDHALGAAAGLRAQPFARDDAPRTADERELGLGAPDVHAEDEVVR